MADLGVLHVCERYQSCYCGLLDEWMAGWVGDWIGIVADFHLSLLLQREININSKISTSYDG